MCRASDGYFKSSVNSPFGSNLPPVPSSPPRIPYSSIETSQPIPQNHSIQNNHQNQSTRTPQDSIPSVDASVMSLEDCEKLALEMKNTVMKLDQADQEDTSNGV